MEKFQKDITFARKVSQETEDKTSIEWVIEEVTKTATFKELDRTDKDQHKLHGKIMTLTVFNSEKDEQGKINVDSDAVYDLAVKGINCLLLIDESFNAQDKKEFLTDSIALYSFGLWLISEKIGPFFSKFKMT